jgi:thymidylate synthase
MLVISTRNVNGAWRTALQHLSWNAVEEDSRAGRVLVHPTPVTTVYERPWERVLFCETRDANPFFHLFEAMWMLAGREDAVWLDRYVHDFSERFAEPDGRIHGAYGHRWRRIFPALWVLVPTSDQLRVLADLLRREPTTRQAVLTMWSPQLDLCAPTQDRPCNTHCYFQYRPRADQLDMTVLCRSNDVVWGAYGANAVHMSVMHEYVSAMAHMRQGAMYQVSNNWHAYKNVLDKMLPGGLNVPDCDRYRMAEAQDPPLLLNRPLFHVGWDWAKFQEELDRWMVTPSATRYSWSHSIFRDLLVPMSVVHDHARHRDWRGAMDRCQQIRHPDWQQACVQWVGRRLERSLVRKAEEWAEKWKESSDDSVLVVPEGTHPSMHDARADGGGETGARSEAAADRAAEPAQSSRNKGPTDG